MKNLYKYLSLVAFSAILLSSCTEEESLIGYPLDLGLTTVALEGTVSTTDTQTAEGRTIGVTVSIPQSFASDADVEVTATFNSGAFTTTSVAIPAGSTTGSGTITLPASDGFDVGFDGLANYGSLQLTAILLDTVDPGVNYTITSASQPLQIFDAIQFPYGEGVVAGRMTYLLDWANPDINDLDTYVLGFESAETGSRYETDIFNDTHPDGDYTIDVGVWTAGETDIPWKLFFVFPNQTDYLIFEGTFTNLTLGTNVNGFPYASIVGFTKTTDSEGVVSYTNVVAL
ncbi:hypothetical protein [uncultured Muriicola sp.]|uniref:hypothetical protein n=1 Tax=uncultured Muriicola sp. TaxID=1583102 RepID=UPI0026111772|nr:hypothetical protein [uncultured Muriicola sp.]